VANLTQEELRDRILEHLAVKAAGQAASAEDAALVDELVTSAYDRLNKFGIVPFPLTAIPTWAQTPLRDFVAIDASPSFGKPVDRLPDGTNPIQNQAKIELQAQVAGFKHRKQTKATYY
jgi:hypothetical protein